MTAMIDAATSVRAFLRAARRFRRNGAKIAILLGTGVLAGCPLTSSQWVEAPLLADAVVDNYAASAQYTYNNAAGLPLQQGDQLLVKFSLATLPNGSMSAVTIANQQASYNSGFNYSLTANKVVHARLVLYVSQLNQAGYLGITTLPGTNCWPKGNAMPTCAAGSASASNPANADVRGMDADNAANPLKASTPGYVSFDVTAAVKAWITNPASNNGLQIRTFADPVDNSHGNFVFDGLEAPGGVVVPHRPQLLVTVSDLIGQADDLTTTYVDQALPASNFNGAPLLLLDGSNAAHAFALLRRDSFDSPTDTTDSVGFLLRDGTALKATVTSYIPTAPLDQTTIPRVLSLFASDDFNPATITYASWNAPVSLLLPVHVAGIDPSLPAQVVANDGSSPYMQKLIATYNQDLNLHMPPFTAALTTSLQLPLPLENAAPQRRPRVVYATYGTPAVAAVDTNDDTYAYVLKLSSPFYDNRSVRLGQSLGFGFQMEYQIDANNVDRLGNAISLFAPASGASVTMSGAISPPAHYVGNEIDVFPSETEQSGSAWVQMKAVGATGSYVVHATTPGHNTRLQVHITNLPVPVPSLAGPAQVAMAAGQTQATGAFTLNVNDPVNANIDDTTKWLFSSSVAADTLPGEMQQTDGSQGFSVTFHSTGPRRLTVTSKGDATITATLDVVVSYPSLCGETMDVAPVFYDAFPGAALDAAKWTTHANGGTVAVAGNTVSLSGSPFPYVTAAGSPIPPSGPFAVRWVATYGAQQSAGTGSLALAAALPASGANSWSNVANAWQDSAGYRVEVRTAAATVVNAYSEQPPQGVLHDVEYCWLPDTIEVYVDGVRKLQQPRDAGVPRPAALWFGNPSGSANSWQPFALHYVEVRALDRIFANGFEAAQ